MKKRQRILVLFVAVAVVAIDGRSYADDTNAAPAATVDDKINRLEQEIQELKHQREIDQQQAQQPARQQPAPASETTAPSPFLMVGPDGFAIASAHSNFVLRLRGYAQADGRFYLDDKANNATDTFLMRRVRPIFEGTLSRDFDFRLMTDLGNGAASSTLLQDAYVEWHYWPWLKVRAGKFKPPVGLEQLQTDTDLMFVERGLPSDLVPQRDVGAQVSGSVLHGAVSYAAGIFNGVVDNGIADVAAWNSKDGAARIFIQPFLNTDIAPLKGLGFGAGGTYGVADISATTTNLPAYKSIGQLQFFSFDKGVTLDGQQLRGTPQAYYFWGPLGVIGEYTVSQEEVRKGTVSDTLRNNAWQIEGGFFLTGETASYRASPYVAGLTPRHPFDPAKGGWGALEIVARFGRLDIDPQAFSKTPAAAGLRFADPTKNAQDAREWEVGLNWYLNRNVKWVFDYEETDFNGGAGTPNGTTGYNIRNRETERAALTRIQLLY
ncbi:MAG TPA: porin [Verrucomicrobiae bacterium]|nr:porin [Verrucomicrobiae bacterium]